MQAEMISKKKTLRNNKAIAERLTKIEKEIQTLKAMLKSGAS